MKTLLSIRRQLLVNRRPLLLFEIIYKLSMAALIAPILNLSLSGMMRLAGYRYITRENIGAFCRNPLFLLFALLLLAVFALYAAVDAGVVLYLMGQSANGRKSSLLSALRFSLRSLRRLRQRGGIRLLACLLLQFPFFHTGAVLGLLATVQVPAFVRTVLFYSPAATAGFAALFLLWEYFSLRLFCLLPCFFSTGQTPARCIRDARCLSRKKTLRDGLSLIALHLAMLAVYVLTALAGILLLRLVFRVTGNRDATSAATAGMICLRMLLLGTAAFSAPVSLIACCALYPQQFGKGMAVPESLSANPRKAKAMRALGMALALLSLAACAMLFYRSSRGHYNLNIEQLRTTEITAHRGASAFYPENTMAAFQGAWEQGADWIELDVQQSLDGRIYVMHDSSLARTTGLRKRGWETAWEEISLLDAGSFFSPDFADERVPLLEEVIEFARWHGIRLNIELKPTGREKDFEKSVIDIIRSAGFEANCVITSQVYRALENVKAYDPEITTVYVMALAYGDIGRLSAADHFSIQSPFITRSLVSRMHRAGKQVYAWTVDSKPAMERLIALGVDNIITNNVPLGKQCVSTDQATEIVQALLEEIAEAEEEPSPQENPEL